MERPVDPALEQAAWAFVERASPLRAALYDLEQTLTTRGMAYGDPVTFFASYRQLCSRMLKDPLPGPRIVLPLLLLKLARIEQNPEHLDSWLDLAGYAVIGYALLKAERAMEDGDGS